MRSWCDRKIFVFQACVPEMKTQPIDAESSPSDPSLLKGARVSEMWGAVTDYKEQC